jgi:hypothetical protein
VLQPVLALKHALFMGISLSLSLSLSRYMPLFLC